MATVIHSVVLFDGKTTHSDATVTFDSDSGKITSVSTGSTNSQRPSGAIVVDGKGHTLLPGLIESHMHCHGMHLPPGEESVKDILRSPLRSGVTTVCDMHSDLNSVNVLRKSIAEDLADARRYGTRVTLSDLKSSLLGATIEGGWPKPIVLSGHPTEEVSAAQSLWRRQSVLRRVKLTLATRPSKKSRNGPASPLKRRQTMLKATNLTVPTTSNLCRRIVALLLCRPILSRWPL